MRKILAENFGRKFWQKILAENFGRKFLAENFGGKFWREYFGVLFTHFNLGAQTLQIAITREALLKGKARCS
jgi:hypothetical protein